MKKTFLILALSHCVALTVSAANLITNGDFEGNALGSTVVGGPGGIIDQSTFSGWRLFNVGGTPATAFNGTLVDSGAYSGGAVGSNALRLVMDLSNNPDGDRALDRDSSRIAVVQGQQYLFTFEAAVEGVPSLGLRVSFGEHDAVGGYLGAEESFVPSLILDDSFHAYSFTWTPTNPNTAQINVAFRPASSGSSMTVVFDNVSFIPIPEPTSMILVAAAGVAGLARRRKFF